MIQKKSIDIDNFFIAGIVAVVGLQFIYLGAHLGARWSESSPRLMQLIFAEVGAALGVLVLGVFIICVIGVVQVFMFVGTKYGWIDPPPPRVNDDNYGPEH